MIRIFDILFSFLALLILSPFFIMIILILKFTGEGEVFYFQERIGQNKEFFRLFKFCTMLKNSPNIGSGTITIKDDPRILPFGKFLRKSKINELPQLINILIGDMSVIGPRPMTEENFSFYDDHHQKIISSLKPGLSGIGSIIFRNEEQMLIEGESSVQFYKNIIAPYKSRLEEWYSNHSDIGTYFLLIIFTIISLIFSNSFIWNFFRDLPEPPDELKSKINYVRKL